MIITRCDIESEREISVHGSRTYVLTLMVTVELEDGSTADYPFISVFTTNRNDILKHAYNRVLERRRGVAIRRSTQDVINSQLPYRRES